MSEDPTRATPLSGVEPPMHGNIGQSDPHADPVTEPGLLPVEATGQDGPTVPTKGRPSTPGKVSRSRSGGVWTGVIASAVVLLFLLIFILQNLTAVQLNFLWMSGGVPVGVALLFAAIGGVLLVALPGAVRIMQLRKAARRGGVR